MTNPFQQNQAAPQGYGQAVPQTPPAPATPPQFTPPAPPAAPQAPDNDPWNAAPPAQDPWAQQTPAQPAGYGQAAPQTPPAPPAAPQAPQAAPQPQGVPGIQTSPQGNPQATAPAVNLAERFAHGTAGGGDKLLSEENMGRPVVVRPIELAVGMQTQFGASDAIRAEWIFLDDFANSGQAEVCKGLIFPSAVVRALNDVINNPRVDFTIGTITKAASAKPGQSPAWLLADAPEWVDTAVAAITQAGMV